MKGHSHGMGVDPTNHDRRRSGFSEIVGPGKKVCPGSFVIEVPVARVSAAVTGEIAGRQRGSQNRCTKGG